MATYKELNHKQYMNKLKKKSFNNTEYQSIVECRSNHWKDYFMAFLTGMLMGIILLCIGAVLYAVLVIFFKRQENLATNWAGLGVNNGAAIYSRNILPSSLHDESPEKSCQFYTSKSILACNNGDDTFECGARLDLGELNSMFESFGVEVVSTEFSVLDNVINLYPMLNKRSLNKTITSSTKKLSIFKCFRREPQ